MISQAALTRSIACVVSKKEKIMIMWPDNAEITAEILLRYGRSHPIGARLMGARSVSDYARLHPRSRSVSLSYEIPATSPLGGDVGPASRRQTKCDVAPAPGMAVATAAEARRLRRQYITRSDTVGSDGDTCDEDAAVFEQDDDGESWHVFSDHGDHG